MGMGERIARGKERFRVAMIRLTNVRAELGEELNAKRLSARALKMSEKDIAHARIVKKSVDARDKGDIHFTLSLDVVLSKTPKFLPKFAAEREPEPEWLVKPDERLPENPPVVAGLGPGGLFAALTLAKRGLKPIVLERGRDVHTRRRDVARFFSSGELDESSNVQFGEGGAGAFSDGKLNTGIKDPRCRFVLSTLYQFGAPEEILYDAKPHIGTDRLPEVVMRIREEIIRLGGEVRFSSTLTDIITDRNRAVGVRYTSSDGKTVELPCSAVLMAIGHSARDTFEMLAKKGILMERKPFSIGARIEHSQEWLNKCQYGAAHSHPSLGAADYKLSAKASDGRGVYTFCMCPGGTVVAAASEKGGVVTNGMSEYARDYENCNAALLVDVRTDDFPEEAGVLAGVEFQRKWEAKAFEIGGGDYKAPAQLVGDFLKNIKSKHGGGVQPSYKPGVCWTRLSECLPEFAVSGIREGILAFDRRMRGFADNSGVLTGVETRSSSPVRILRDAKTFECSVKGIFPIGEGAGYAGGILSAAVDGIRVAEAALAGGDGE